MAIALDPSGPAAITSSGATTTSAAFTPPSSSVLVAMVSADANNGNNGETVAVSDSAAGSWNTAVLGNGNGGAVSAIFWRLCPTSPGSITVSATDSFGAVAKRLSVQVWTGTDQSTPIGATVAATAAVASYTSTVDQSQGVSCGLTANATLTAGGSGNTLIDTFAGFDSGDATFVLNKTALTTPAGSTVTLTIAGTATIGHHVAAEIVPPGGAPAAVPFNPQRTGQVRDYGETWWLQRDLRDANTVGSAVNVLPTPLDTAWQAGGRYWHLYNDSADAAPRTWQSLQRPLTSDPNLLATIPADPLLLAGAVGGDTWRRYNLPDYADRREVPAQRPYVSGPLLLATAELEGNLLGGADTAKRTLTPATHNPRTWMPQQPPRAGTTPGLLDQAELEGALLGGAETAKRNLPATHADRREMPQQRPYLSDPSFYPTTTPTDPLTLAWGAGGTYWLIYNLPAVDVDRREVPTQRAYISDPNLLLTALLENELLGGGDIARHRTWYSDRRVTAPARPPTDPSLLTAAGTDPTSLAAGIGGDMWRRLAVPAYTDRRQTAAQPPRVQLYFDAGPASPPLTLSWGAGGNLWHLYNPRRTARNWWPGPALFVAASATCDCITHRPNTGTTARGSNGTTARPNTGTTQIPCSC